MFLKSGLSIAAILILYLSLEAQHPEILHKTNRDSLQIAWVRQYASGLVPASDRATGLATDSLGNIYIAGYSSGSFGRSEFLTLKYNSSGEILRETRYTESDLDLILSSLYMQVDKTGNIYIAGERSVSYGYYAEHYDIIIIKYDSSGVERWKVAYQEQGIYIQDLVIDTKGNVFVTGYNYNFDNQSDSEYITIKYNNSGQEQWVARYAGPRGHGQARAMAIDINGYIYITGSSLNTGSTLDYTTIKYNTDGEEQWVVHYTGISDGGGAPTKVKLDREGNVYVTGASMGVTYAPDIVTVKYNSNGEEKWVARYEGIEGPWDDYPTALEIDSSGYVYVAGWSRVIGHFDYITLKYDSTGNELWRNRYDGMGASSDKITDLKVDRNGNIYVTGWTDGFGGSTDYLTLKYNSTGEQMWEARYRLGYGTDVPCGMILDTNDNIYVTGSSFGLDTDNDITTLKYNPAGEELWVSRYNGEWSSNDRVSATALAKQGNLIVTGWSKGSRAEWGYDFATIKYDFEGNEEWIVRYNGPGNKEDIPVDIKIDQSDNIFVTGISDGAYSGWDYATLKYDRNGNVMWVSRYQGSDTDFPSSLTVDLAGNVYVTGRSISGVSQFDIITLKYNSLGEEQWVQRYNGTGNLSDGAEAIISDHAGNIYLTGFSYGISTEADIITIKYNTAGVQQWIARYNGTANSHDVAYALTLDYDGNVYVTGESQGPGTQSDFVTIKYNRDGYQQWAARYNGPGDSNDVPIDLVVDNNGNVYITGKSEGMITLSDFATIKYNPDGELQWARLYDDIGNGIDEPQSIQFDKSGNVYVCGTCNSIAAHQDIVIIRYTDDGEESSLIRYGASQNYDMGAADLLIDAYDNLYVSGSCQIGDESHFLTIRYTSDPFQKNPFLPNEHQLYQNYPNPSNIFTNFKFALPNPGFVNFEIYNILGQKIETLLNQEFPEGTHIFTYNAQELTSGIYFYRIKTGKFQDVKKMIVLK